MSWVLMMVVMSYSSVMPCINSSMTREVLGSRPELGSSQKRYLGFSAMARAMATRFCMPPEISPGNLSSAPVRFTRSRQNFALLMRSVRLSSENMSRGNITFSSTDMESKSAADWKIIPISRRSMTRSLLVMFTKLRPSYRILPESGVKSPTMFFMRTVLPEPDCPMIRFVLPFSKVALMPLSTSRSPKDLCRSCSSIMRAVVLGRCRQTISARCC